ncbi:MAG: hypothetical protein QOE35_932 [Actinomycetota bacterium]
MTLIVVATGGGGDGKKVTAGTSTSSSAAPTTTTTSTSTTTTAPPETTTTVPPEATTTAAPATTAAPMPVVTGQGAVLREPATSETRVLAPGAGCDQLGDNGWTVTCGMVGAKGGVLAWLLETRDTAAGSTARRALVLRRASGQQWTVALRVTDDSASQFTDIKVRTEDVSGDGASEIAFGFSRTGASSVLAVDLVEGPGTVVVHRDLPKGVARVSSGQLDTWRRADSTHDVHEVIQFRSGAWHVVASAVVPASDVPPSQL